MCRCVPRTSYVAQAAREELNDVNSATAGLQSAGQELLQRAQDAEQRAEAAAAESEQLRASVAALQQSLGDAQGRLEAAEGVGASREEELAAQLAAAQEAAAATEALRQENEALQVRRLAALSMGGRAEVPAGASVRVVPSSGASAAAQLGTLLLQARQCASFYMCPVRRRSWRMRARCSGQWPAWRASWVMFRSS